MIEALKEMKERLKESSMASRVQDAINKDGWSLLTQPDPDEVLELLEDIERLVRAVEVLYEATRKQICNDPIGIESWTVRSERVAQRALAEAREILK